PSAATFWPHASYLMPPLPPTATSDTSTLSLHDALPIWSNRLMALLYRNLERAGVRSPEHDVLKGNWRYHWYLNRRRLRDFAALQDRKSTRLNSSHVKISYAVFCLKKKKTPTPAHRTSDR